MIESFRTPTDIPYPGLVPAGQDRFGETRNLGISTPAFKVASTDSSRLFVLELTSLVKGGPGKHLHREQEEWFYVVGGDYLFEVGEQRMRLHTGDSLLIPVRTPHVWAFAGEGTGKLLITFTPAGNMEAFFRESARYNTMPPLDLPFWNTYGMELLGPPLPVE